MRIKRSLSFFIGLCMLVSLTAWLLVGNAYAATPPGLSINATIDTSNNYINLTWTNNDASQGYHYMITKRDVNTSGSTAQTIPLKGTARVLNIYPGDGGAYNGIGYNGSNDSSHDRQI